ncbi:MAG: hypothetical protein J6M03_01195, partial [Clostridia bacterium]|nr:hypothetical protein [Clostridia bacterium]
MSDILRMFAPRTALAFSLPDFIFSGPAILIYILVIVAAVTLLVFALAVGDSKDKKETTITIESAELQGGASSDGDINENGERFCMLSEIDREKDKLGKRKYEQGVSLEYFCESFRNFAAYELKLYYDIEDIRRFVSGLAVSKMLILQGMSGTGKTSLAHALGTF